MAACTVDDDIRVQLLKVEEDFLTSIEDGPTAIAVFQERWITLQAVILPAIGSLSQTTLRLVQSVSSTVAQIADSFLQVEQFEMDAARQLSRDVNDIMSISHPTPGTAGTGSQSSYSIHDPPTQSSPPVETAPVPKHKRQVTNPPKTNSDFSEWVPIRDWFLSNIADPYPSNTEKKALIEGTSITLNQFNAWLNNLRRRCRWTEICRKYADGQRSVMKDLCNRIFMQPDPTYVIEDNVRQELLAMRESVYQLYRQDKSDWWGTVVKMVNDMPEGLVEEMETIDGEDATLARDMRKRERREERERRRTQKAMRRALVAASKERLDTRPPATISLPEDNETTPMRKEEHQGAQLNLQPTGQKRKRIDETNLPITPPVTPGKHKFSQSCHDRHLSGASSSSANVSSKMNSLVQVPDGDERPSKRNRLDTTPPGICASPLIDSARSAPVNNNTILPRTDPITMSTNALSASVPSKRKRASSIALVKDAPSSGTDFPPASKDCSVSSLYESDNFAPSRPRKRIRQEISVTPDKPSSLYSPSSYSAPSSSPASVASSLPSLSRSSSGNFNDSPHIDDSWSLFQDLSTTICPSFAREFRSSICSSGDESLSLPPGEGIAATTERKKAMAPSAPGQELVTSGDAMASLFALDWTVSPKSAPTLLPDSTSLGRLGFDFEFSDILEAAFLPHLSSPKHSEQMKPMSSKSKGKRRVVIEIEDSAGEFDAFDWLAEQIPNSLPDEEKIEKFMCHDGEEHVSSTSSASPVTPASAFTPEELRYLLEVATSGSATDPGMFSSGSGSESHISWISSPSPHVEHWKKTNKKRKTTLISSLPGQGSKTPFSRLTELTSAKNGEGFGGNVTNDSPSVYPKKLLNDCAEMDKRKLRTDDARRLQAKIVHEQISHHQSRLAALESQAKELGLEI